MQRGLRAQVPRITARCASNVSVSSRGTVPPSAGSASDQWKDTRKAAQQAPQDRHGCGMTDDTERSPRILRIPRHRASGARAAVKLCAP